MEKFNWFHKFKISRKLKLNRSFPKEKKKFTSEIQPVNDLTEFINSNNPQNPVDSNLENSNYTNETGSVNVKTAFNVTLFHESRENRMNQISHSRYSNWCNTVTAFLLAILIPVFPSLPGFQQTIVFSHDWKYEAKINVIRPSSPR